MNAYICVTNLPTNMKFIPPISSYAGKIAMAISAVFIMSNSNSLHAQGITVDETISNQNLASLITGNGVSISNINVRCNTTNSGRGYGKYTSSINSLNLSEGLLLTTGRANGASGPNNAGNYGNYYGSNSGSAVSSDSITTLLNNYSGKTAYEYCLFEFDVIPQGDTLIFDYMFASEEYNEWVGSDFNDIFGFFIKGPGIVPDPNAGNKRNLARVAPGTGSTAVAINTVNANSHSSYYRHNSGGNAVNMQYDGYTRGLFASSKVIPCSTYRLQLIIADCGDRVYDSGVFIEQIRSNAVTVQATTVAGVPAMVEGCNNALVTFTKPTVSSTPITVNYWLSGTAINGVDYNQIGTGPAIQARQITFPSGSTTATLTIVPIQDNIAESTDTVMVSMFNANCPAGSTSFAKIGIRDSIGANITPSNVTICEGGLTALSVVSHPSVTSGLSYSWSPIYDVSSTTGVSINAYPTTSKYIYSQVKLGNCIETEKAWVNVNPRPLNVPTVPAFVEACLGGASMIHIPQPQTGISYQLRYDATNAPYGNAQVGANDSLTFITPGITVATDFSFYATNPVTGCGRELSTITTIHSSNSPKLLGNNLDSRKCLVTGSNWVTFTAPGTDRAIASINPNGQYLGWVTITEYVNANPINVQACNTDPINQPQFTSAAMGRRWVTTPQFQPSSPIDIRFYINNSDFENTKLAANANANLYDNLNTLNDLALSKYSGPNEDGDFDNNCNTGGVTSIHTGAITGNVTSLYTGFQNVGRYATFSIPSCSEMWLHGFNTNDPSPLPVVLDQFTAECSEGNALLKWTTTSEVNNDYFSVQISDNSFNWSEVASIKGAGNSNEMIEYQYEHKGNRSLVNYYRLVQYDFNGDYEVFPMLSLYCQSENLASWNAFPNPNQGSFTISLQSTVEVKDAQIQIIDMAGKTVFVKAVEMGEGSITLEMNAVGLAHGAYVVRAVGKGLETLSPLKIVVN